MLLELAQKTFSVCAAAVMWGATLAAAANEWTVEGVVTAIADGDTLTVLDEGGNEHKIRIAGIDAPERKQPYGRASRQHLADLVLKRQVTARCYKREGNGPPACRVYEGERDIGLAQVRAGMAWHDKAYQDEQTGAERRAYRDDEVAAISARRGLWSERDVVPPWEWRKRGASR